MVALQRGFTAAGPITAAVLLLFLCTSAAPASASVWSSSSSTDEPPGAAAATQAAAAATPPSAMQALLDKHSEEMMGQLQARLEELLQQQREVLLYAPVVAAGDFEPDFYKPRSRVGAIVLGVLVTAAAIAAAAWGWARHAGLQATLRREDASEAALERQDPIALRRLVAQATHERTLPPWLTFPDFERVEWLNSIVAQLWPHASAAVVAQIKSQLDPALKANKPPWIGNLELSQFTLGDKPPRIKGIKVYDGAATGEDVVFEADAVWASDMHVTLKVQLLPERIPLLPASVNITAYLTKFLSKLVFVKMGVTDVSFSGRVRVAMTAVGDKLPVVGSLQVSLVQLPRFSFGVTLYEYLNLMVLPGLEQFVHFFIRDILLRPYTLPESITIPLMPGATGRKPPPAGLLFVRAVEATNVPNLDWRSLLSKPDTFLELSVRSRVSKKTKVAWNSKCPKWGEEFRFLVHYPEHQQLSVVLKDYDRVWGATEVGRTALPIHAIEPNSEQDLWLELTITHKGFASLRALKGAMSAMKVHPAGAPTRVAQVEDAGGLGFEDVEGGPPPVEEITPPDEVPSDDDASVFSGPSQQQRTSRDRPEASPTVGGQQEAGEVDDVREMATSPGVCNARGECASWEQDQQAPSSPSSDAGALVLVGGRDTTANGAASPAASSPAATPRRQATSEREAAAAGSGSAAAGSAGGSLRRGNVDAELAAARRRHRGKEPCKVHLVLTYVQVGAETVKKAEAAAHSGDVRPSDETEAKILSALRGGVLEVKLHRPKPPGRDAVPAKLVTVKVGEREKKSAAARGEVEDEAVATEEVLDFVVDGELADDPGAEVTLQVYDQVWIADLEDTPMWEWEARSRMPTQPVTVSLPLRDIISAKHLHKAWRYCGGDKVGILDVDFEWLGVLDVGAS